MDSMLSILTDFDMCLKSLLEIESSNTLLIDYVDKDLGFTTNNLGTLSVSQIIDTLLSIPWYISPYFYLRHQTHELSIENHEKLNHIHLLLLRNEYSKKHFEQPYYRHHKQLVDKWNLALQNGLTEELFTTLDKQRTFLRDFYATYFESHSLNHFHLLSHLYGQEFVEYHYYCLKRFKHNYAAFMKRTQLEKNITFKSHLFVGMPQPNRARLYQKMIDKVFNKHFDCQLKFLFHQNSHIMKKYNENAYTIALANNLTFADELDQLLAYLGEIFYMLVIQPNEHFLHTCCTTSYAKEQIIAFFQFLPLACPSVAEFITKTALEIENIPQNKQTISFYHEELLMYYLSFHTNPLRKQLINPLQRINLLYCEATIEKLWFNEAINSSDLPHYWDKYTFKKFKKSPSHPIEGTLRMDSWKEEKQGQSFIKLASIINLFREEFTTDGEVLIFKKFADYFNNNCIHLWDYHQIIHYKLSDEINPAQNTLNFIGKFYHNYIYKRPLSIDKY